MADIQWAGGSAAFYTQLRRFKGVILTGDMVVIDPSIGSKDSAPGYAIFKAGQLQVSGTIALDWRNTSYKRTQLLLKAVAGLVPMPPDLLAIEAIHRRLPGTASLLWAVGVSIAAAGAINTIEVPITFWKSYAKLKPGYIKGDEADAIAMGEAMIAYCKEINDEPAA